MLLLVSYIKKGKEEVHALLKSTLARQRVELVTRCSVWDTQCLFVFSHTPSPAVHLNTQKLPLGCTEDTRARPNVDGRGT